MKVLLSLFSISVLASLFDSIRGINTCNSYRCANLTGSMCARAEPYFNSTNITMHSCQDGFFCNLDRFPKEEETSACEAIPAPVFQGYAGDPCQNDTDCFTSKCSDAKVCQGFSEGDRCTVHFECGVGLACLDSPNPASNVTDFVCLPQLKEGAKCNVDFDCENNLGCLSGVCKKYFSIGNGEPVDQSTKEVSSLGFCESGTIDTASGRCWSFSSIGKVHKECNDTCEYTAYNKGYIQREDYCVCSLSENGKRYCKAAPGDDVSVNRIKLLKSLLNIEVSSKSCHTHERSKCTFVKKTYPHLYQSYLNSDVYSNHGASLINAPLCVKKIKFPHFIENYESPECPRVTCCNDAIPEEGVCAKLVRDYSDFHKKLIFGKPCKAPYICDTSRSGEVDEKGETIYRCITNVNERRYPGEMCVKDSDCVARSSCYKGECQGSKFKENCFDHSDCFIGLYCNKDTRSAVNGTCLYQKSARENCTSYEECKNSMVCSNDKCVEFGSVKDGQPATDPNACKSGFSDNYRCDSYIYNMPNKTKEANGFYKCDVGDANACIYKSRNTGLNIVKPCECGLNPNGISYCPLDMSDPSPFYRRNANLRDYYLNNNCHTSNRFQCNETNTEKVFNIIDQTLLTANQAHVYVDAPPCVISFPVDYGIAALIGIVLLITFLVWLRLFF